MSEERDLKDWAIPPEKLPEYESIPPKPKVCHSTPEKDAWAKLRRSYFKTLCATRHRETIVVGVELLFLVYQSVHTVEVAVNVKLQKSRRVIGRSSSLLSDHTFKAHPMQIEGFHKRINHMDCVVLAHPIVQALRQKRQLGPIGTFDKTSHPTPPSNDGDIVTDSRVFTQPGPKADIGFPVFD